MNNAIQPPCGSRLRAALAELDRQLVTILSLYHIEKLGYFAIGKVMGISRVRVRKLHRDAISQMRTLLGQSSKDA